MVHAVKSAMHPELLQRKLGKLTANVTDLSTTATTGSAPKLSEKLQSLATYAVTEQDPMTLGTLTTSYRETSTPLLRQLTNPAMNQEATNHSVRKSQLTRFKISQGRTDFFQKIRDCENHFH